MHLKLNRKTGNTLQKMPKFKLKKQIDTPKPETSTLTDKRTKKSSESSDHTNKSILVKSKKNSTPSKIPRAKQRSLSAKENASTENKVEEKPKQLLVDLRNENDRLKTENKSLRTRLLQSVASDFSVKSQAVENETNDEETVFMMLQEYIAENEALRKSNDELKQQFQQTSDDYNQIAFQNDHLKTRILVLERQVAQTETPEIFSPRQSNFHSSHEAFMKKMANFSQGASRGMLEIVFSYVIYSFTSLSVLTCTKNK